MMKTWAVMHRYLWRNKILQVRLTFPVDMPKYRIRPSYRTVRLGFSKLLGTLSCGKICIYLLRIHYKKDQKRTYLMMIMRFFSDFLYKGICCGCSFELHRQVNAIQMSTHNICLYKEVKKKYTGCNLKTMEFLDCALTGVCAVIRSYMVWLDQWHTVQTDQMSVYGISFHSSLSLSLMQQVGPIL